MEFFGRELQLQQLHKLFDKNGLQVALVYGRRRVGKSELIKQCLRNEKLKSIYYECKQTTEPNNVESLSALICQLHDQINHSPHGRQSRKRQEPVPEKDNEKKEQICTGSQCVRAAGFPLGSNAPVVAVHGRQQSTCAFGNTLLNIDGSQAL